MSIIMYAGPSVVVLYRRKQKGHVHCIKVSTSILPPCCCQASGRMMATVLCIWDWVLETNGILCFGKKKASSLAAVSRESLAWTAFMVELVPYSARRLEVAMAIKAAGTRFHFHLVGASSFAFSTSFGPRIFRISSTTPFSTSFFETTKVMQGPLLIKSISVSK